MIKTIIPAVLVWLAVLMLPPGTWGADPSPNDSQVVRFSQAGINYTFALPKGFSAASGGRAKWADTLATMDKQNLTQFTLLPTAENQSEAPLTAWAILKSPRAAIGAKVSRPDIIQEFKGMIKSPDLAKMLTEASKETSKTVDEAFGGNSKTDLRMEVVSTDDTAAYLAGTASFELSGVKSDVGIAAGITVVRGNVFYYYRYKPYHNLTDIADLLGVVKTEIAQFIKDNPE